MGIVTNPITKMEDEKKSSSQMLPRRGGTTSTNSLLVIKPTSYHLVKKCPKQRVVTCAVLRGAGPYATGKRIEVQLPSRKNMYVKTNTSRLKSDGPRSGQQTESAFGFES